MSHLIDFIPPINSYHLIFIIFVLLVKTLCWFKPKMCLDRPTILTDNIGNTLNSVSFLDEDQECCDHLDIVDHKIWHSNSSDLICIQLNIRGLLNKQAELLKLVNRITGNQKVDVIMLQETWITKTNLHLVDLKGYIHYGNHRHVKRGGGISVFISNELTRHEVEVLNKCENFLESCFVEIKLSKTKLCVGSIYRPPNTNKKQFNDLVMWLLKKLKS